MVRRLEFTSRGRHRVDPIPVHTELEVIYSHIFERTSKLSKVCLITQSFNIIY